MDHESDIYQLAMDIDSATSFASIVPGDLKLTLYCALSTNVDTNFKPIDLCKWNGTQQAMETEIWSAIPRDRGFFDMPSLISTEAKCSS